MSETGEWDVIGTGPDALVLPALSSISTRREMHPLAERLGDRLRCVIPDWPGFGARDRGRADLSPAGMRAFLDRLLRDAVDGPVTGIGAGHAATFLVDAARRHPGRFSRLLLIAPTWRGPFPSMFDGRRPALCRRLRRAMEMPVLGSALYALNLSSPVVARMMRAHVYAEPGRVTAGVVAAKRAVARQDRARFGTAAFISGGLDPVSSRGAFLELFAGVLPRVTLLRPRLAPPRSGAEMDAAGEVGHVRMVRIPGALAPHEEFPDAVAAAVRTALNRD